MIANEDTLSLCEERKRLNEELSFLIGSKMAMRDHASGAMILEPSELSFF